jgi:RNA-directed DNA polymerase
MAVNGPENDNLDWESVHWPSVEEDVRRLRQRIFTASQAGDLKRVRSLQKLMLRSRANTLVSVRRVTEQNAGRETAGVDGKTAVTAAGKATLVNRLRQPRTTRNARPVKRVYIPKSGDKLRPLGIPVIFDRAQQALVKYALEPEWEARFEPKSYGFRPGRGCHDAIEAIFHVARGPNPSRRWCLDADLAAAFDRIDHSRLLSQLGGFPARKHVEQWLKAGVVEHGRFTPTVEGTPQGGVISPVLLNVALHGMEQAAGVRYQSSTGSHAGALVPGSPAVIRYADDLVALCHSKEQAEQVKARLAEWLVPRGLTFNEDKTRVVSLAEGFDFLGFTVRRQSGKLLIKPSKAAVKRYRERLRVEMRSLRGANAVMVLQRLTPIVRGWSAYYRTVVSSELFSALDRYLWKLTYKWAKQAHPKKSKRWIVNRYFGRYNKSRNDRWVFGDRDSGAYLAKHAWTKIIRHQMVKAGASPDDPALVTYWAGRRRRAAPPPMDNLTLRLLQAQRGTCPICGDLLLYADQPPQSPHEWTRWVRTTGKALAKRHLYHQRGPADEGSTVRLVHTRCQRRPQPGGTGTSTAPPAAPGACLSRGAGKAGSPLTRGDRRGNPPVLPDELVGQFVNGGREWRPAGEPVKVNVHDFLDPELGKAIPYGVYDLGANTGWVNVGCDHDTAAFAVESIRRWWYDQGATTYPDATRLMITADAGGSNGYRTRAWKIELAALAAETGLTITVGHLPPGTSKWNKIEHRLFSHITMNWRGRPLTSHEVMVATIAATTSRTGLRVRATLDTNTYPLAVRIVETDMAALPLSTHAFHGDWNYALHPNLDPTPVLDCPPHHDTPTDTPPAPWDQRTLSDPLLTGMPRNQLDALTAELDARHHPTDTGTGRPPKLIFPHQVLATVLHLRLGLRAEPLAILFDSSRPTIYRAFRKITQLLNQNGTTISSADAPPAMLTALQRHVRAQIDRPTTKITSAC